jgi:hypothetical protein
VQDSYTSEKLMSTCREVAAHGRVVIMSLHQPSANMLDMVDKVMFLARGFKVYSGPPSELSPYLSQLGLAPAVGRPVAEHMLQLISQPGTLLQLLEAQGSPYAAASAYKDTPAGVVKLELHRSRTASDDGEVAHDQAAAAVAVPGSGEEAESLPDSESLDGGSAVAGERRSSAYSTCGRGMKELAVLFRRAAQDMLRTPSLLVMHAATALLMGLLVGCCFFKMAFDTSGAHNRAGAFFFSLCLFGFTSLSSIDNLVLERELVEREVRGYYYHSFSYLMAKLALDGLLLRFFPVLLYTLVAYPMMGLVLELNRFATFLFVLSVFACIISTLAVGLTALLRNAGRTTLVMNLLLLVWVLLGGFLVDLRSIPVWVAWARYVSPLSYAFEALLTNETKGQLYQLGAPGVGVVDGVQAESIMLALGLDPTRTRMDVLALVLFYFVALVLAVSVFILSLMQLGRLRGRIAMTKGARGGKADMAWWRRKGASARSGPAERQSKVVDPATRP